VSAAKNFLRGSSLAITKVLCRLCYDEKYLRGRFFTEQTVGWKWALRSILFQKIIGYNRHIPWPVSPFVDINSPHNIEFDPDDLNIFHANGVHFQNFSGRIVIGKGTYIGHNVGIITANHDPYNLQRHSPAQDVVIGKGCWLGMNSVVLPGVHLGDGTIVGANAVVTKSFPEGRCVLAGVPARCIKTLQPPAEDRP